MGKKFNKICAIVFFPIAFFVYLIKVIIKVVKKALLRKYLKNISVNKIDSLDGKSFEDFLYYFFLSLNLKVKKTSLTRDYGADLIIDYNGEKIVIQCKNYYNHKVGNSAIQEIATAKDYYNATIGIVITNWFFTSPAQTLAGKVGVKLIDRNILSQILHSPNTIKNDYFVNFIDSNKFVQTI
ncbi:MAG: restriction endonuclease [Clostridiales bacterium]|nr:restriction endonuclease [Clostridiales bacterium]